MQNVKVDQLHRTVVEAADKVQAIITNHENSGEEELTFQEKFSDNMFAFGSSWRFIFVFAAIVIGWIVYNVSVPPTHRLDKFPFLILGFILTAVAAIQAPIIMMSQHRQNDKASKRIALDLKVDNEILSLHRSIVILMEQQMQQVHENQLLTIRLLEELHVKSDRRA
jgi:uncharacterized membrane protein